MRKQTLLILFFIALVSNVLAQDFTLGAEIRPRTELRDGYKTLFNEDDHIAFQTSQRTRLNFDYKKDILSFYISIQDVRLWGDIAWKKDVASTFLNEAWAKIDFNPFFSAKFGRQELSYDNQRLIAASNWSQVSAKHDALKFQYRKNKWEIDFITAYNQSDNLIFGTFYDVDNFYKSLNILWISNKIGDFKFSTLHIIDGIQDPLDAENTYSRYTSGVNMIYAKKANKLSARFYYQTGSVKIDEDLSAYYFNLEASRKLNKTHTLVAGIEYMSGDKEDSESNNSFNVLYGKRHGGNGYIDYYHAPNTTKGAGLVNPYLKFISKLGAKSELSVDYHYFSLQQAKISTGEVLSKGLGSEIDFTYKYNYSKDIKLQLGYSMMFASESAKIIKGGTKSFGQFAYIMLTIKPVFFTSN